MHQRAPIIILLFIFLLGLDSTWGLIFRNGYYAALVHLRDFGPHLLPGSDTPIQQHYTGLGLLDYWLTVLQCVFANVTDGTAPHLSLFAFQFAGQLVSVLTVLMIEGMREGNRQTVISLYVIPVGRLCFSHLIVSRAACFPAMANIGLGFFCGHWQCKVLGMESSCRSMQ
jgi:hypothetical protein